MQVLNRADAVPSRNHAGAMRMLTGANLDATAKRMLTGAIRMLIGAMRMLTGAALCRCLLVPCGCCAGAVWMLTGAIFGALCVFHTLQSCACVVTRDVLFAAKSSYHSP